MKIKEVKAKAVKDSRGEKTISIIVKTKKGKFVTSAPEGKSKGEYEVKSYSKSLEGDINFINNIDVSEINELDIEKFEDLGLVEKFLGDNIGGNSLFAIEACLLKALARENGIDLWKFILGNGKIKFPRPVGNCVGGGMHSRGEKKKPDFQEFLFISDGQSFSGSVKLNEITHKMIGRELKSSKKEDEGAWKTELSNEEVLGIMKEIQKKIKEKYNQRIDIGIDIAASSFYKDGFYVYKNFHKELDRNSQIKYIAKIIKKYDLFYIEDGIEENDFEGFAELGFEAGKSCLIVGDDLTTTNPGRFEKAIRLRSINAIIVKPNQIGSLLKVKKVIDNAKNAGIKTVISHRSGETNDDTIADLCVGFQCDFIKTGVYGSERKVKLKRLIEIEKKVMRR